MIETDKETKAAFARLQDNDAFTLDNVKKALLAPIEEPVEVLPPTAVLVAIRLPTYLIEEYQEWAAKIEVPFEILVKDAMEAFH
jgi:hypothetical protein